MKRTCSRSNSPAMDRQESALKSRMVTFQPFATSSRVTARPMPEAPPVTMATGAEVVPFVLSVAILVDAWQVWTTRVM